MVRIPRSEQSVGVSGNALPFSSGDGFAAPGRALADAGKQLTAFALTLEKQNEDLDWFEGQRRYQEFVNGEDQRRRTEDANIGGDGRGHADRLDGETDGNWRYFLDNNQQLTQRTRQRLAVHYERDRGRFSTRSFEVQQRRIPQYYTEQADHHFTTNIAPRLFQLDPETGQLAEPRLDSVRRASAMVDQWLDGAAGLPPSARESIRRGMAERIYGQWLQQAGPEAATERQAIIEELRSRGNDAAEQPDTITGGTPSRRSEGPSNPVARAIARGAGELGIRPEILAGIIHRETAGSMSPDQRGGYGRAYVGLIQFSPENQRRYGIRRGMSPDEQMTAVVQYYRDRFERAGLDPSQATTAQLYAAVLAGDPRHVNSADINGSSAQAAGEIERRGQQWWSRHGADGGVIPVQMTTEDRVRQYIVDNAVQVEDATRRARVRADTDEGRAFRNFRNETENTLLDRALRTRQMVERGDSPEAIREAGGLTSEELRSYVHIVRRPFYDRVHTILNPRETGVRLSEPGLFSDMLGRARSSGTEGATPPQVVMDEAQEAFVQRRLTSEHLRIILDTARRNVNESTATPRWVSDHFLTLRNGLVPRGRRMNEAESRAFDEASQRLNQYVNEQRQAGTLDNAAMGQFTTSLIQGRQQSNIDETMTRLRAEPKPRMLSVPVDSATPEHVTEALAATRAALDAATTPEARQQIIQDVIRLRQLQEVLSERERMRTGSPPPPARSTAPRGRGEPPGGAFEQFPLPPGVELNRGGGQQPQPPAEPLRINPDTLPGHGERRGFLRRIIRDDDGNITGLEEVPNP